jgi:8-oxo-dGTP pyrophosphatase MutT (NUDIX family)
MLDNSVAGGIAGGMTAFDTLVKEAAEEASLDPQLVRKKARSVGAVSYYRQTDAGWLQPEVQFVYDMHVEPGEARLAPMDGEVESFKVCLYFFVFKVSFLFVSWIMYDGADSLCRSMRLCLVCTRGNSSQIARSVGPNFSSKYRAYRCYKS